MDTGEIRGITALLHISASLTVQERPEDQTLPRYLEKKDIRFLSHLLWLLAKSLHTFSRISTLPMCVYIYIISVHSVMCLECGQHRAGGEPASRGCNTCRGDPRCSKMKEGCVCIYIYIYIYIYISIHTHTPPELAFSEAEEKLLIS